MYEAPAMPEKYIYDYSSKLSLKTLPETCKFVGNREKGDADTAIINATKQCTLKYILPPF